MWHQFLAPLTAGVRVLLLMLTIVSALTMFPCAGLKTVLIMLCGGLAAWVAIWVQTRLVRARASRPFVSERMGRLEL